MLCKPKSHLLGVFLFFCLFNRFSFILDFVGHSHLIEFGVDFAGRAFFFVIVVVGSDNVDGSAFEVVGQLGQDILARYFGGGHIINNILA